MPASRLASPPPGSRAVAASSFPLSCPADEGGRTRAEYDHNGHYLIGPRLGAPSLVRMIAERAVTEPPDVARATAERRIAADRRTYRQGLPIPTPDRRTPRVRRGGGYAGLVLAIRGGR